MKKNPFIFLTVAVSLLFFSCTEKLETPSFGVTATVKKTTVLNGDETEDNSANEDEDGSQALEAYEVTFKFSGNADNIVLYSGEPGSEYRYNKRYYRPVTTKMSFISNFSGGNIPHTLRIMASNDFKPEYLFSGSRIYAIRYTREAAEAATWLDITDRFNLPGNELITGARASGEAIIAKLHMEPPLFIGFRFDADKTGNASLNPGQWVFSQFQIKNELEDGTTSFYIDNVLDSNWQRIDFADATTCSVQNNVITLRGASNTTSALVISRPLYPSYIDTDKGITVKTVDVALSSYTYTYVQPQTESVRAVFVATNSLYGDVKQEVKEIEIVFSDF